MKKIFPIFLVLSFFFSACIGTQLDDLSAELDSIKDTEIASLSEQMSSVVSSMNDLNKLRDEIKASVEKLSKTKEELQNQIDALNTKLENIKKDFNTQLEGSESDIIKQLQTVQAALEAKVTDIETTIKVLNEKDASLEKKIADLKTYSDGTFGTKTWVEGTFATIESQNALIDDITVVKAQIEQLETTLGNVETEIKTLIQTSIEAAKEDLDEKLSQAVTEVTDAYTALIAKTKKELIAEIEATLEEAINASTAKIRSWVNGKLKDYYTVAAAEAQIQAMNAILGNVPSGKNLQSEIDELTESLQKAKQDITKDYTEMIAAAIQTSEGKMTAEMDRRISELRNNVITPLTDRVSNLETEVGNLTKELDSLVSRVNTLDEQIAAINKSLAVLSELKVTLKEYVESMQKTLEDADAQNKAELQGYIDELEKLLTDSDPSSIQSQINALKVFVGTIPSGETSVVSWVENTRDAINEQFKLYATIDYVNQIKTGLETMLDSQDQTVSDIQTKLSTIIEDSKELICSWIDTRLADYWTTTQLTENIANLKATLQQLIESGDDALSSEITALEQDIKDAEASLQSSYEQMISDAILSNNAIISKTISDAFAAKSSEVSALSLRIDAVKKEIDALKKEVAEIRKIVFGIRDNLDKIQDFIKESGITALQPFIDEINAAISDCQNKYASLQAFTDFKQLVETLKTEVEKLDDLESRIKDTEDLSAALTKFLLNGFDEDVTLADKMKAVNDELQSLWDYVNGQEGQSDLQSMIDAVNKALYGEGGSQESPTSDSMYSRLKGMMDKIIVCRFASVAYVPDNDSRMAKFVQDGDVFKATLKYEVRPTDLTPLLVRSSACNMVYVDTQTRAADFKIFDNVSFTNPSEGIIQATIIVNDFSWITAGGASVALFVDLRTQDDLGAVNFTSSFVSLSL